MHLESRAARGLQLPSRLEQTVYLDPFAGGRAAPAQLGPRPCALAPGADPGSARSSLCRSRRGAAAVVHLCGPPSAPSASRATMPPASGTGSRSASPSNPRAPPDPSSARPKPAAIGALRRWDIIRRSAAGGARSLAAASTISTGSRPRSRRSRSGQQALRAPLELLAIGRRCGGRSCWSIWRGGSLSRESRASARPCTAAMAASRPAGVRLRARSLPAALHLAASGSRPRPRCTDRRSISLAGWGSGGGEIGTQQPRCGP